MEKGKQHFVLKISQLPPKFQTKIIEVKEDEYVLRANLESENDINNWVREFGSATQTQWNVRRSRAGNVKIYKEFVCHHSSFMKVPKNANRRNKTRISKNADCLARVRISVNTVRSKRSRDPFVKIGLWASIRISRKHSHTLKTDKVLRFLQDKSGLLRDTFFEYFDDNMTASEARHFHEYKLSLENGREVNYANGSLNPTPSTVSYWFKQWRSVNLEQSELKFTFVRVH